MQELEEELEKAAIGVLVATAKHFPEIVLANLQERIQPKALPHHSILCAMVKLCQLKGTISLYFLQSRFLLSLASIWCHFL